jgi:phosphoribosylformimino-5-aminoimidazole carboxamide ribotide isomerase
MSFSLYPAIDLRDGGCVRLIQGDYDREIKYEADPVEVALAFQEKGASWIHVVDLDAARSGTSENLSTIAAIAKAVRIPVQSGGGVRSIDAAKALFASGVSRCVVGTAAVENPSLVEDITGLGHRVAVGLDVRGEMVATQGWEQDSGLSIYELLPKYENAGAEALVVTQINRDGMGTGPDIDGLRRVLKATSLELVASGGVGALEHITQLAKLRLGSRGLAGVIVGKAIHDGVIDVSDAVKAAEQL